MKRFSKNALTLQDMNKEDFLNDDFLRDLIRNTPLDAPSDDFMENVMGAVQLNPRLAPVKQPFYLWVKSAWPYALAGFILVVFLFTSDLPFTNFLPGKDLFAKGLLPYFESLFAGMKNLFVQSKFTSVGLTVLFTGGLLVIMDQFLSRKTPAQHTTMML
jgi:hypothetical protein